MGTRKPQSNRRLQPDCDTSRIEIADGRCEREGRTLNRAGAEAAADAPIELHILHKLPTPYTDEFFRLISQDHRVRLHVHHLWATAANRPWKSRLGTGYPNEYMKLRLGIDWHLLRLALTEREAFFLVNDWGHMASLAVIAARELLSASVGLWVDTPQEQLSRPPVKRWLRQQILDLLLPRLNVVFATGRPAIGAVTNMGVDPDRTVNLPFVIDLDVPRRARREAGVRDAASSLRTRVLGPADGVLFAIAGQLTTKKGFDIGVKAFADCAAAVESPVGLIIAGDGPLRGDIEAQVTRLGIGDRVALLGWIEPDAMLAVYMATDVLVHPARWDPYPLVVLEAMSWGKPVIGSDVSGSVQDRINSGVNGFAFPSEDESALADFMRRLAEDGALRSSMGRAARATAEEWPMERGLNVLTSAISRTIAPR